MREVDLFNILKITHCRDLEKSENQYSRFDCYSKKYKMDIELKCRNKHYDDLIIEKDKYDALIRRAKQYETTPFYINSTPQGIYVFNLSKIDEPIWEDMKGLPKTSHFTDRSRITKTVGFLSIHLANKISE
tara:strand:- start:454 stop:846 length:393 start_codon:yes stop_codon:yes gene_type:complete